MMGKQRLACIDVDEQTSDEGPLISLSHQSFSAETPRFSSQSRARAGMQETGESLEPLKSWTAIYELGATWR
jgi:hypothetical protein